MSPMKKVQGLMGSPYSGYRCCLQSKNGSRWLALACKCCLCCNRCKGKACCLCTLKSSMSALLLHFHDQPCLEWPISIKHPQQTLEILCVAFAGKLTFNSLFPSFSVLLTFSLFCIVLNSFIAAVQHMSQSLIRNNRWEGCWVVWGWSNPSSSLRLSRRACFAPQLMRLLYQLRSSMSCIYNL